MRRRDWLRSTAGSLAALSLGETAHLSSAAAVTAQKKNAGKVRIRFAWMWGLDNFSRLMARKFTEKHPHIEVEVVRRPDPWMGGLLKAYQKGEPYNLAITAPFYSMWATQAGYTIDPSPLMERDFGPDYKKLFYDNMFFFWQKKMVGLPFCGNNVLFYYNQDLLERAGLDPPGENWTWEDMVRISSKTVRFAADGKTTQRGCAVLESDLLRQHVFLEGEDLFSPDYRQAKIDTPAGRRSIRALYELLFQHKASGSPERWKKVAPAKASSWDHAAFYRGEVALLQDGDIRVRRTHQAAARNKFRLGVAAPLCGKQKAVEIGPTIFQIFKSPRQDEVEASWEFAKFWLTPENQALQLFETGRAPVRPDAYDQPHAKTCLKKWPGLEVFRKVYAAGGASTRLNCPTMAVEYDGMRPFVQRFMQGQLTPEETVGQMQKKCQAILDKFWTDADQGKFAPSHHV